MKHTSKFIFATIFSLAASGLAVAQGPGGPGGHGPGDQGGWGRPPMERAFHDGQFGRWWDNPRIATAIGLTDDEKKKMDGIFQQHRLNLIDLHANLEKAEVQMEPLIEADQPDEAATLAQIDKVAQARAELEKANARMLFDIRKTLTPDQWQKLKALHAQHREEMGRRDDQHGHDGQGGWQGHHHQGPPQGGPGAAPPPPQGGAAPGGPPPQGDGDALLQ
ncbi:MAG: Spy/CpxP family protein refolding chaperone [Acidobacteriaceae bacterium]